MVKKLLLTLSALSVIAMGGDYEDVEIAYKEGNLQSVVTLLEKAADQGNAGAQFHLGLLYEKRWNHKKVLELYKKAAKQGNADAQFHLGLMHARGTVVQQDDKKAAELYQKAADQGHVDAQLHLGFMYSMGKGVQRDHQKTLEIYQKAANQGDVRAQAVEKINKPVTGMINKYDQASGLNVDRYYKNGVIQKEKFYDTKSGKVISERFYKNGVVQKEKIYNTKSGKIRSERLYKSKVRSKGLNKNIVPISLPISSIEYYYHPGSDTLWKEIPFRYERSGKRIREGVYKTYYPTGELASESPFINDKREGLEKQYYESDKLRSELLYKNDKPTGIKKMYTESGQLQSEMPFKDGKRHGVYVWYWYDKNGKRYIRESVSYTNEDIEHNPEVNDTETKIKLNEGEYVDENTLYIEDTDLIVEKDTKKPITGILKMYHPNGNLKRECSYKDGKIDGICKRYYENGNLQSESVWKDGTLAQDGIKKSYYPDASLRSIATYVNGKRHGVYTSYHNNGNIHQTGTYEHGTRTGIGKIYYENGNLEATLTYKDDGSTLIKQYDENGKFKRDVLLPKRR